MKYLITALTIMLIQFGSIAQCTADFDWETDQLEFEFINFSFGTYDSLWIDFGDGNGTNDSTLVHEYDSAGFYTVCLSLFDAGTMCDSVCYEVFMSDTFCEADFSFLADELVVQFFDESEGPYNAHFWDFGDFVGGFSEDANPEYTYLQEGTYEVCLFVYDSVNFSCEAEHCEEVTVEGDGGGGGGPCQAKYSYTANELEIAFKNLSSGGLITTWDFGDGSAPNFDEEPTYVYSEPGSYEVCLSVINPFPFCIDEYCETIEVVEYTCEPYFTYTRDLSTNTFTFFDSTVVGEVTSVLWEFGDGNTSTFEQPIYTYNAFGAYKVCLTTYDDGSECGKICKDVNVFPLGLDDSSMGASINIYPNPNNGSFTLDFGGASMQGYQVQITDVAGRLLLDEELGSNATQAEFGLNIEAGTYFLRLMENSNTVSVSPFVVR